MVRINGGKMERHVDWMICNGHGKRASGKWDEGGMREKAVEGFRLMEVAKNPKGKKQWT